jgi:hypothetical protein
MKRKTRKILEAGARRAAWREAVDQPASAGNPPMPGGPAPKKPPKAKGDPIKHGAPLANAIAALVDSALGSADENVLTTDYLEMLHNVLNLVEPYMGSDDDDDDDDTQESRVPADVQSFLEALKRAGRGGRRGGMWLY